MQQDAAERLNSALGNAISRSASEYRVAPGLDDLTNTGNYFAASG